MTPSAIVTQIVSILTSGITGIATGIGTGIADLTQNLWFTGTGDNQAFSIFAIMLLAFAGVSLAIALCRLVFNWLSSLCASK